jgi:hypothetical protein
MSKPPLTTWQRFIIFPASKTHSCLPFPLLAVLDISGTVDRYRRSSFGSADFDQLHSFLLSFTLAQVKGNTFYAPRLGKVKRYESCGGGHWAESRRPAASLLLTSHAVR